METVALSSTGLRVSRIGLGCEPLGGVDWGVVDQQLAMRAVSECLRSDINLFDTADVYGLGRSEELLSAALGSQRRKANIVSKFGLRWEPQPGDGRKKIIRDSSARWAREAVDLSLRRLKLERIPIYLVHWPDPISPMAETMHALDTCRREGKIGCIGVSNFSADQIREAHSVVPLAVVEILYNILDRRAEAEVLPLCQQLKISVVSYGALAQGLLTGKYKAGHHFAENDRRHRLPHFQSTEICRGLQTVEGIRELGTSRGRSPAQVAIRWVLDHPAISCVIVGAKSPDQVRENIQALDWKLSPEERSFLSGRADSHEPASAA